MSPRPDRRAERVPQILQAARAVFARRGFAEARMEDIAGAAGLSKAALYLYFPGKDDLIAALLEQYVADAFADLAALRGGEGGLRARLGAWAERRIVELEAEPVYLAVGYEFFALAARQEGARQGLRRAYGRYREELEALIAEAAARGERTGPGPRDQATALVALFEGLTLLWMLDPGAVDLRGAAERTLDALLGGPA